MWSDLSRSVIVCGCLFSRCGIPVAFLCNLVSAFHGNSRVSYEKWAFLGNSREFAAPSREVDNNWSQKGSRSVEQTLYR